MPIWSTWNLLFNLRVAFVDVLQAMARVLDLTKQELEYYDHIIEISRERNKTGAMAQNWIWTEWSCSACSMSLICKWPKSACAPQKFSFCNWWTIRRQLTSLMFKVHLNSQMS